MIRDTMSGRNPLSPQYSPMTGMMLFIKSISASRVCTQHSGQFTTLQPRVFHSGYDSNSNPLIIAPHAWSAQPDKICMAGERCRPAIHTNKNNFFRFERTRTYLRIALRQSLNALEFSSLSISVITPFDAPQWNERFCLAVLSCLWSFGSPSFRQSTCLLYTSDAADE